MTEFEKTIAEIDTAEANVRSAVDRLVEMIFRDEPFSSQAAAAVANLHRILGRSIATALLETEDPSWRNRLLWLLDALEPPRDYETFAPVAQVADEDWDHDVRAHARQILEEVNFSELCEERYLSARKAHV
jgi:hypothetical protein